MPQLSLAEAQESPLDQTGLCILTLDGGGVRGLSTLLILKALMARVNLERKSDRQPSIKPCQLFDMIGGTSTGGIIAIMLGRLEMDVDDCIKAYTSMFEEIFGNKGLPVNIWGKIKGRFDFKVLEDCVAKILAERGLSEAELLNDGTERCKVVVCSKSFEVATTILLRSYDSEDALNNIPATICQAVRATSAASGFFEPVIIGQHGRRFIDGGLGANNPVEHVWNEAQKIWCRDEEVELRHLLKCFVSIGTGIPGRRPIAEGPFSFFAETLVDIVTQTEETAKTFIERHRRLYESRRYFRFNVQQGLQEVGLDEYKAAALIDAATTEYMDGQETKSAAQECAVNLKQKQNLLKFSAQNIVQLSKSRHSFPHDRLNVLSNSQRTELLESLYVAATRWRIEDVETSCLNTFEWVFDPTIVTYTTWLTQATADEHQRMYWIKGKPGSGKSTLMKYILESPQTINQLRYANCNDWILSGFFIHGRGTAIEKSFKGLLCRLLYDILQQVEKLNSIAYPLYALEAKSCGWTVRSLQKCLREIIGQRTVHFNLCFFVDALDEFDDDHWRLAEFLVEISRLPIPEVVNFKICIASRPWNVFYDIFQPFDGFSIHEYTHKDIEVYSATKLKFVAHNQDTVSPLCKSDIMNRICENAHGSFIWVTLVTDRLLEGRRDGDSEAQLIRHIESLPIEIEDLYGQILGSLKPRHTREALVLLQIYTCLHQEEQRWSRLDWFLNLVALSCGEEPRWTDALYDPTLRMLDEAKRFIFSRSGGLLEIFEDKSWRVWAAKCQKRGDKLTMEERQRAPTPSEHQLCVQPIHHTVKHYLSKVTSWETLLQLDSPIREQDNGHVYLFRHMLHNPQRENYTWYHAKLAELQTGKSQIQLLKDNKVSETGSRKVLRETQAMDAGSRKVLRETQAMDDANIPSYAAHSIQRLFHCQPQCKLISWAVAANLLCFIKALLDASADVDIKKEGRPLLHYAIRPFFQGSGVRSRFYDTADGRANMVRLLLQQGERADVEYGGYTALHVALYRDKGDYRFQGNPFPSFAYPPSQYEKELACLIVPMLLHYGANLHTVDRWGYTALGIAIRRYHNEEDTDITIIKTLLDNSADINSLGDACSPWIVEVLTRDRYKHLQSSSFKRLRLLETLENYGINSYDIQSQDPLEIAIGGFENWLCYYAKENSYTKENSSDFLGLLQYIILHGPRSKIVVDLRTRPPLHSILTRVEDRILRHDIVMMLLESGFAVKSMLPYLGPSFDRIVYYALTDYPRDLARSYDLIRAVLEDGIDPNGNGDRHSIHIMLGVCLYTGPWCLSDTRLIKRREKFYVPQLNDVEFHLWEQLFILLLSYKANPNLPNRDGETAWDRLKQANEAPMSDKMALVHTKCLKLLRTHSHFSEVHQSKRFRSSHYDT